MEKMEWERNSDPRRGPPGDATSESARDELFRQRRQLLWLTFALVIYYCADVKLGHEAETQGVKLAIQHPQFLVSAAWCAWVWSFWRYWQYERTHPDTNYRAWREHQTWLTVVELGKRKAFSEQRNGPIEGMPADHQLDISIDRDIQTGPTVDGGLQIKNYGVIRQSQTDRKWIAETVSVNLSAAEFDFAQRQGNRDFLIGRPYALDYKAPYLLALLAPAARLWTWIF